MVPCGLTRQAGGSHHLPAKLSAAGAPAPLRLFVLVIGGGAGGEVWGPSDRQSETLLLVALEFGNRIRFALAARESRGKKG